MDPSLESKFVCALCMATAVQKHGHVFPFEIKFPTKTDSDKCPFDNPKCLGYQNAPMDALVANLEVFKKEYFAPRPGYKDGRYAACPNPEGSASHCFGCHGIATKEKALANIIESLVKSKE